MKGDLVTGTRLRIFRKKILEATLAEMGKGLSISGNIVGKIERGETGIDFPKLQILSNRYNMNLNWWIAGLGTPQLSGADLVPFTEEIEKKEPSNLMEEEAVYQNNDLQALKTQIKTLTIERNLYKKLYEKQEIEVEFYKSQLKN